eukprot:2734816-Pleurochrysis_carterae.AAC.1
MGPGTSFLPAVPMYPSTRFTVLPASLPFPRLLACSCTTASARGCPCGLPGACASPALRRHPHPRSGDTWVHPSTQVPELSPNHSHALLVSPRISFPASFQSTPASALVAYNRDG